MRPILNYSSNQITPRQIPVRLVVLGTFANYGGVLFLVIWAWLALAHFRAVVGDNVLPEVAYAHYEQNRELYIQPEIAVSWVLLATCTFTVMIAIRRTPIWLTILFACWNLFALFVFYALLDVMNFGETVNP